MLRTNHTYAFLTSVCQWMSVIVLAFLAPIFHAHAAKAEGICDRTPQVNRAILDMLSTVSDCASITMNNLAEISILDLSNVNLSTLQAGDFNGLSNLTDLDLQNNQLRTLPESIFSNLQSLNRVRLGNNHISELPDGVFTNLPSLGRLGLNNNQLNSLSDNLFTNVPNLFELDLRGNRLEHLSTHIFDDVPALTTLGLDQGDLEGLSFQTLAKVKRLQLDVPMLNILIPFSRDSSGSGSGGTGSGVMGVTSPSEMIEYKVRASRLFAAGNQYPPDSFAAYGIVAFRSLATTSALGRYIAICEGYLASILSFRELVREDVQHSQQMATIWPLRTEILANRLNSNFNTSSDNCPTIVHDINLNLSQNLIRIAERQMNTSLVGDGPFLLAWSPTQDIVNEDTLVLSLDLSHVMNDQQATRMFNFWIDEIEKDPELWSSGWSLEHLRLKLQLAADKFGEGVLQLFGIES